MKRLNFYTPNTYYLGVYYGVGTYFYYNRMFGYHCASLRLYINSAAVGMPAPYYDVVRPQCARYVGCRVFQLLVHN